MTSMAGALSPGSGYWVMMARYMRRVQQETGLIDLVVKKLLCGWLDLSRLRSEAAIEKGKNTLVILI